MKAPSKYPTEIVTDFNASLILESISDSLIVTNSEGEIKQINKQTEIIFGYSREELIGQKIEILLPERFQHQHIDHRNDYYAKPRQRPMGVGMDLYARCQDGTEFPCEISLSPIEIVDEIYIVCSLRDNTEHKAVDKLIRQASERISIIHDSLPVSTYTCEVTDNYAATYISNNVIALTGFHPEDFISDPSFWAAHIHPEDVARVLNGMLSVTEKGNHEHEYRWRTADGSYKWFYDFMRFVKNADGNVDHIIGMWQDITERKQAEDTLLKSEQRLRRYFDLGLIGMAITSLEKKWFEFNDTLCDMLGYSRDELASKTWAELTHPDDLEADITEFNRVLSEEKDGYIIEKRFIHKNGSILYTEISVNAARKADGSIDYFIALVHDLTEKKQAEKEASQQRERLAHLIRVQTLGEMATGIAHEINQPLAAIESYAQASQRYIQSANSNPDKIEELLNKISGQAKRAGKVVSRLRAMMQCRTVIPIKIDINALLEEINKIAEIDTRHHDCRLILKLDSISPVVIGDDVQIQQVVLNLIRNAIDAMEELNDEREKEITVESQKLENNDVLVSVTDNGNGISELDAANIFEAFYTTKDQGLGMGLSICKNIIDAHGGEIGYSKTTDEGTTMYFTLPTEKEDA